MTSKFSDVGKYCISLLFPNRCKFCNELTNPYVDICKNCMNDLPWIKGKTCPDCGSTKEDCGCKHRHGHYFDSIAAPLYYENKVKDSIHDFKFKGYKLYYKCFADLMTECCKEKYKEISFDYVTYIPMDKHSQRIRGYNQSALLAKRIAENLGIEFADKMIVKLYCTDIQHELNEIERKGNLFGAFDINKSFEVEGKSILLIDDVKTSGSTLSECGKMLYLYGANSVNCLTVALINSKINR